MYIIDNGGDVAAQCSEGQRLDKMANEKKDVEVFKKMLNKFRTNVYCHGRNFEEYSKTEKGEKWNEKNFVLTNQIVDLLTEVFEKGVTKSAINKFMKLEAQFE